MSGSEPNKLYVFAFIKPFMLDYVIEALLNAGYDCLWSSDAHNFTPNPAFPGLTDFKAPYSVKKLELAVDEAKMGEVTSLIRNAARTGKEGDGKIFSNRLHSVAEIGDGDNAPNQGLESKVASP